MILIPFNLILIVINLDFSTYLSVEALPIVNDHLKDEIDPVENAAKLLIQLDQIVENAFNSDANVDVTTSRSETVSDRNNDHQLYVDNDNLGVPTQLYSPDWQSKHQPRQEERFSSILDDLKQIETQIKEAILVANAKRQFRLVMRLRPLLSYITQVHRNMELLRTRVVAIATLSNISTTVNDVMIQFGDVMTSSSAMASGMLHQKPKNRDPQNSNDEIDGGTVGATSMKMFDVSQTSATTPIIRSSPNMYTSSSNNSGEASSMVSAPTTLSYMEIDSETFFKNILLH